MNIKKLLLSTVWVILLSGALFVKAQGKIYESVYASKVDQNRLYSLLTSDDYESYAFIRDNRYEYVKESITPVYTLDVRDFANDGKINIKPLKKRLSIDHKEASGQIYMVKIVDSEKNFWGNEMFVELPSGLKPLRTQFVSTDPDISSPISFSYADHAEWISQELKSSSFIPAEDVRFLSIEGIGEYFYVSNKRYTGFLPVAYSPDTTAPALKEMIDHSLITPSELSRYAKKYVLMMEERRIQLEEYQKDHPGENLYFGAPSIGCMKSSGKTNDIYRINEYLASGTKIIGLNPVFSIIAIIAGSVVIVALFYIIILRKRCRHRSVITKAYSL